MYVFSPRYTVEVVLRLVRPRLEDGKWRERLRASLKYVILAGRREKDDEEGRGRGRSGGGR